MLLDITSSVRSRSSIFAVVMALGATGSPAVTFGQTPAKHAQTLLSEKGSGESSPALKQSLRPAEAALADEEFQQGVADQDALRWEAALDHYRKAWALNRASYIGLNLGIVEHHGKQWSLAAEHLSFGLQVATPPKLRARAEELLALAKVQVTTVWLDAHPEGTIVLVDGVERGRMPLGIPVFLDAGTHRLTLISGTRTNHRELVAEPGKEVRVTWDLREPSSTRDAMAPAHKSATQTTPRNPNPRWPPAKVPSLVPALLAFGAAGIGLVGSTAFTVLSLGNAADRRNAQATLPGASPCEIPTVNRDVCTEIGNYRRQAQVELALAGVGYALTGAGILAGLLLWPTSSSRAPQVSLFAAPGLMVRARF